MIKSHLSFQNVIAVSIFLMLITATSAASLAVHSHFSSVSQEAFENVTETALEALEEDLHESLAQLGAIQGLFNASDNVTREEFDVFVSLFFEREKSTQALEWIPRVASSEREAFVRSIKREGYKDFSIHPATERSDSFPVTYVFPFEPNLPAFGFDLATNDSRFTTIQRSRDSGMMQATAPITLIQETGTQSGFLVFAPIYSTGDVPDTLQKRQETLTGFALAVFRVDDLMVDAIPAQIHSNFNLSVSDSGVGQLGKNIHSQNDAYPELAQGQGVVVQRMLDVAGREWILEFAAPFGFGISTLSSLMWMLVLGFGGVLSALTLGFSYLLLNSKNRAIVLAETMNRSLLDSETQRDQMFEQSRDLIITVGRDGRFVFVSGASRFILGHEPSEMVGNKFHEYIYEDDRDKASVAMSDAVHGHHSEALDLRLIRKDGSLAWLNWSCQVIPGRVEVIFAIGRDVTRQREAEAEIRDLAKFPSEDPNPVLRISGDGKVMYANVEGERFLRSNDVSVGDPPSLRCLRMVEEALRSGSSAEDEFEFGDRHFTFVFAPIMDAGYVNVYGRDITERKSMDRMKDEFVSIVSHELRTPVTSIKGFLELIMDGATDSLNEDQLRFLEAMRRNTNRLENLVNDLLELSRLEGGMVTIEQSDFNFVSIVNQVLGDMASDIEAKQIKIILSDNISDHFVRGDRDRVVQILANLLSNAVKYSPAETWIEIGVIPTGDASEFVKVYVKDHGLGIPDEDITKLFHKFHRIDNSTTRSTAGTGLGLSITKALVELHGGEIWVESQEGEGSTFSFTLPSGSEPMEIKVLVPSLLRDS
jgi:PAS domain S-box-containing protein